MGDDLLFRLDDGRTLDDVDASRKVILMQQMKVGDHESTLRGVWSEIDTADTFADLYGSELKYCPEYKSWFVYTDGVWKKDEGSLLSNEKLKNFTRLFGLYASTIGNDDVRNELFSWAAKLTDRRVRDRVLKDAAGCEGFVISAVKFDSNPYLINCLNGTYDLKTFSFRPHDPEDYLTMQTQFDYTVKTDMRCERWERFIAEVTQGDNGKARYLQKSLGYSMLGKANEECMFILHGKTTRNGKSTMLNTIEYMLGDYSKVAPVGMICKGDRQKDAEAASPTLAGLKGKRFVTMAESNEYGKLDEEKIKQMTGGEEISARALYQSAITYTPQFTLWLSCNDLPDVSDKSLFASDRLRVIEFNRHFSQQEQDKHLKDELTSPEAMMGIFSWMIDGYKLYTREGLLMPENMGKVVRQYENDNDLILQFLEDKCEVEPDERIKAKDIYIAFKAWCRMEGMERVMSAKRFYSNLEKHPGWYEDVKRSHGDKVYYGLRLKGVSI